MYYVFNVNVKKLLHVAITAAAVSRKLSSLYESNFVFEQECL